MPSTPNTNTIDPAAVALDALAWTMTHDFATGDFRDAPIDPIEAMREAMRGLYSGGFRAWSADLQNRAADEIGGYLATALDERAAR